LLNNANKLPLVITATCDFAPFDDPTKQSLGNELLLKNNNGAIALITTTRTVFAYSNRIMNEGLLKALLSKTNANSQYLTLGQALLQAKNELYGQFSDVYNNRKFTLLGDPGIRLAFPQNELKIDSVVEVISSQKTKLFNPQKQYVVHGTVINADGNKLTNFNGLLEAQIWPFTTTQSTLGNSPESPIKQFAIYQQTLFNGKATINNGQFHFNFFTPADLQGNLTKGRVSLYATNSIDSTDAGGADTTFLFGGTANNNNIDNSPPQIDLYINHFGFVSGGIANNEPILLARIKDDFGLNTLGTTNEKPMMVWVDDKKENFYIVNNYYTTNINDFNSGVLQFQLPPLSEGMHSVTLKVWDANNNPAEKTIFFQVKAGGSVAIFNAKSFPNPVVQLAKFEFEHNQPMGIPMKISLLIYDFAGRMIKKSAEDITVKSSVISNLIWDGTGMNNEKIPSGVYIYRIIVQTKNGSAE
ncbi:MAG: C25 family cysteine peptidase, partial [Chitinophagaceae bacterium]